MSKDEIWIANRSTIQKVLDSGIREGIFETKKEQKDKRKTLFILSIECEKFFEFWVERQTIIFSQHTI